MQTNHSRHAPYPTGFVYFVETEDGRFIKIGYSDDVEDRFYQLSQATPYRLRFIGFVRGGLEFEAECLESFKEHKHKGEWFHDCAQLRAFIQSLAPKFLDFARQPFPPDAMDALREPDFSKNAENDPNGLQYLPGIITGYGAKRIKLLDANIRNLRAYCYRRGKAAAEHVRNDPKLKEARALLKKLQARRVKGITVREVLLIDV